MFGNYPLEASDPRPPVPHIDFYCGCGTKVYMLSANFQGIGIPEWDYTCEGCGSVYGFVDSIVAIKKKRSSRLRAKAERAKRESFRPSRNPSAPISCNWSGRIQPLASSSN
jgi:hypothetical protein